MSSDVRRQTLINILILKQKEFMYMYSFAI